MTLDDIKKAGDEAGFENKLHGHGSDAQTDAQAHETKPTDCTRFDRCAAPICPLDRHWRQRAHLRGEPLCLYLRESVKADAGANLAAHLPSELLAAVVDTAPAIIAAQGDIRRRLVRASRQSSMLASARRMKRVIASKGDGDG